MPKPVDFTIHPTDQYPLDDALFAIIPDDFGDGYLVGELSEVVNLINALSRVAADPTAHDGVISSLDERLRHKWLSVAEAAGQYDVPAVTIRWACQHGQIDGAEKQRGRWRFPLATFMGWLAKPRRTGRPREWGVAKMANIVKGTRICKRCRGICHENSWREKHGKRHAYWCSEKHLRESIQIPVEDWESYRDNFYEQVDCGKER